MRKTAGERTLLASVLLSSPGPLVVGIGLFLGQSSTQLADFIRRSAELVAIIVSWAVFRILHKDGQPNPMQKARLERIANTCVGAAMGVSGVAMVFLALFSSSKDKGNVIPGLAIAVLGVITNTWFWIRYRKLNKEKHHAILASQSKLYFAKSLVDLCVATALCCIMIAPYAPVSRYVDTGGSVVVAAYLIINGMLILRGKGSRYPEGASPI